MHMGVGFVSSGSLPGSQAFTTPGTTTFTVPEYTTLTVKVFGGGAPGYSAASGNRWAAITPAGASSFNSTMIGPGGRQYFDDLGGAPVTGSGGDTNYTGGIGSSLYGGGAAGNPGVGLGGAAQPTLQAAGNPYGGGGGSCGSYEGGNGGGAATKTYAPGQLTVGASIAVVVGVGGIPYTSSSAVVGGVGAPGAVLVEWT